MPISVNMDFLAGNMLGCENLEVKINHMWVCKALLAPYKTLLKSKSWRAHSAVLCACIERTWQGIEVRYASPEHGTRPQGCISSQPVSRRLHTASRPCVATSHIVALLARMAAVERDFASLREEQNKAQGVAASLEQAVFDQDLYGGAADGFGGYDRSIGVAGTEEDMDEREAAVRRCCTFPALCSGLACPCCFAQYSVSHAYCI